MTEPKTQKPYFPHTRGLLLTIMFFSIWVGSISFFLFCVFSPIFLNIKWPWLFLVFWYIFRLFVKPKTLPWLQNFVMTEKTPYIRNFKVVFDGFDPKQITPDSKHLLCFHPHGALSIGWCSATIAQAVRNFKATYLASAALMKLPLISDFLSWLNTRSVDKATMELFMSKNMNLGFIPGGFEEATLFERGKRRVYIKNRTGFIKIALQHGYSLVPGFSFGEEWAYWTFDVKSEWFQQFRFFLNKIGIPGLFFIGKWFTFLPDFDIDLVTVFGPPIPLPLISNPSREEVCHWHEVYMKSLVGVFDRNKGAYLDLRDGETDEVRMMEKRCKIQLEVF